MKAKIKALVRCGLVVALIALVYWEFPVPSAKTPNAQLALNTWANEKSAQLALLGYKFMGYRLFDSDISPRAEVSNQSLCIYRNGTAIPDVLTFHADNIVALGLLTIVVMGIAGVGANKLNSYKAWKQNVKAIVIGAAVFAALFVVRDFLFGVYVHDNPVEAIGQFDEPVRWFLQVVTVFIMWSISVKNICDTEEGR